MDVRAHKRVASGSAGSPTPHLSSQVTLNEMRHDAAMALNVLCGAPLTHTTIETSKRVVDEWLVRLEEIAEA